MSPTDPSRDSNSSTPNGKDENPFIKFKRFADAQIGAVLQGVIGLPSVFSKQPNDAANSRWADLHDDLKRRDEARAEQQAPPTSDSTDREDGYSEEEEEFVKRSKGWPLPTPAMSETGEADRVSGIIDVIDWNRKHPPRQPDVIYGPGWTARKFFSVPDDQKKGSAVEMIQKTVLDAFHPNAGFGKYNPLQSSQPILPYILFSPYSPLALSSRPGPLKGDSTFATDKEDDFPYCEAFQDLLLASQGRPMSTWFLVPDKYKRQPKSNSEARKALAGIHWIDNLYYYGLLTKEFPPSVTFTEYGPTPFGIKFEKKELHGKESQFPHLRRSFHGPEEEHYALLDDPAGQCKGPMLIADLMSELDCLHALFGLEDEDPVAERRKKATEDENRSCIKTSSRNVEAGPTQDEPGALLQFLQFANIAGKTSTATQTETFLNREIQPGTTRSENSVQEFVPNRTGEDQVVSTTTTTEHVTEENGSMSTTVTVKKIYVDGRSLVTSTSKTDIAPKYQRYYTEDELNMIEEDRCPYCDAKYDDEPDEKQDPNQTHDKKGKGWFWN